MTGLCSLAPVWKAPGQALVAQVIKEGIKKVIIAVDLRIQRLQTKTIMLQNAEKTMENTMSKLKLQEISGWVEKQRDLYKDYYSELWKVKGFVLYYSRIKQLAQQQTRLVEEYRKAWRLIQRNPHFSPEELDNMAEIYAGILDESAQDLDQVLGVIQSFQTQMKDADRMLILRETGERMDANYLDLLRFNRQNILISLQRAKSFNDLETLKKLYGIRLR